MFSHFKILQFSSIITKWVYSVHFLKLWLTIFFSSFLWSFLLLSIYACLLYLSIVVTAIKFQMEYQYFLEWELIPHRCHVILCLYWFSNRIMYGHENWTEGAKLKGLYLERKFYFTSTVLIFVCYNLTIYKNCYCHLSFVIDMNSIFTPQSKITSHYYFNVTYFGATIFIFRVW